MKLYLTIVLKTFIIMDTSERGHELYLYYYHNKYKVYTILYTINIKFNLSINMLCTYLKTPDIQIQLVQMWNQCTQLSLVQHYLPG